MTPIEEELYINQKFHEIVVPAYREFHAKIMAAAGSSPQLMSALCKSIVPEAVILAHIFYKRAGGELELSEFMQEFLIDIQNKINRAARMKKTIDGFLPTPDEKPPV